MRRRAIVLTLAVAAAFLGITATPASAGQSPATVSGDFECTEPGVFTVTWTIENLAGTSGEVVEATLSGAAEGDITDSFTPNPFEFDDETIVGSSEVSGDTVGTVTLDATVAFDFKGPFEFDVTAEVDLDGSCEAPPTSEDTSSTTASVAATADVRPTFTG